MDDRAEAWSEAEVLRWVIRDLLQEHKGTGEIVLPVTAVRHLIGFMTTFGSDVPRDSKNRNLRLGQITDAIGEMPQRGLISMRLDHTELLLDTYERFQRELW